MKYILLTSGLLLLCAAAFAQGPKALTIEECYQQAQQNYPLMRQRELIKKSMEYSVENAAKGYYPQLSVNGQATYQSDVTQIPVKIPGMNIPTISKDQYKLYGELSQTVYDGGLIKMQKQNQEANAEVEQQKLEIELYKLKERINQLYFGILLMNEQLIQTGLVINELNQNIRKAEASVKYGVALKSNRDVLQAELLKARQREIELKSGRSAYLSMLALLTGMALDEQTQLTKPAAISINPVINRPELLLFERQKKMIDVQNNYLQTKNLPKIGLFVQAGYGRPALNMLNNDFASYYIGGARLSWSLSGFYTIKKDKSILDINRNIIDLQKETFLFNTNFTLKQQSAETIKLQELISTDKEIIDLRTSIKNTANAQLENGVIGSTDYVRELNAEDQAKQNQILHQIQLLMAQYNLQNTSGN